uniref:Odorant-binding protein 14 n=1 Tax=Anopheles farauti TaxID=69004 RepID=A0A9I3GJK8_9DIPT
MKSFHFGSLAVLLVLVAVCESSKSESSAIFGYDQVHNSVPAASTFIVSDFLQFLQTAVTCFNKLRIPEERFPLYLAGVFPNCPETQCFVRCLSANLHLYCDETGSDIDRHYLQYGLGQDYNCFRQKAEQCLAANTSPCNDPCEAAYKQELCFLDEFRKYVDSNLNSLIAAVAVKKTENNIIYYNMLARN